MLHYNRVPWRIAGYFLLLSVCWILLTSQINLYPSSDRASIALFEQIKGLGFVSCTAVFIFFTVRYQINKIVRAEEQLREAREQYTRELEDRVAERTAELEATVAELESFSHTVAHDLRSPIRSIDGFAYTLLEDHGQHLDGEAQAKVARIRNGAKRMSALIDDILKLARIGKFEFSRERVDVGQLAQTIVEDLRERDPSRNLEFSVQKDLFIHGDRNLIRVMLVNLLENAWKFTKESAVARIELGTTGRGGRSVFFVRDNGIGFPQERAAEVFKPFHRLHDRSDYAGSGIGLSTVERIVRRHGGQVEAESQPGAGTTIYLYL